MDPARPSTVNCTWLTFDQQIDHFGPGTGTFPQRYCMYSKWWKPASHGGFKAKASAPGPILFYTGNESPVEEYINNTGLMWEIGEKMGALLVFAEHRYEPLSHPALCGKGTQKCFAYCTTAQANADWASLIGELRTKHPIRAPAVAFGGSYGGMLAGWFRMKYPDVIDGVIAASAPIWQLADTVRRETLDMQAVAVTKGVSAVGGATDQCRDNLRAAWPLLHQVGQTQQGLFLLSEHTNACSALQTENDLPGWAQGVFFFMAEGNYPFPSSYITYSLLPGKNIPLPAWPMRVACEGLNKDFGIKIQGNVSDVKYTLTLGDITVAVDWANATGNGPSLSADQIRASGVLGLAKAIADAAGVWHNVTKTKDCYDIASDPNPPPPPPPAKTVAAKAVHSPARRILRAKHCPVCPPCDDCPPCPVSFCDWEDDAACSFTGELPKTFSWDGIGCNEDLSQIDIKGVGRDIFWPPQVPSRNYTVASIVGPRHLNSYSSCQYYVDQGMLGAPMVSDPWSGWMTAYYGGRNVSHHRNIIWSNGALDPWSGQGVYPPGGGPDGPMVQNISADGSQIALVLDLGAHHLDLMFTHPSNPPCFAEARKIEERMIGEWIQEAYDAYP